MSDWIVTDIQQAGYDSLCEEAAELSITADDFFGVLAKDYAKELHDRTSSKSRNSD